MKLTTKDVALMLVDAQTKVGKDIGIVINAFANIADLLKKANSDDCNSLETVAEAFTAVMDTIKTQAEKNKGKIDLSGLISDRPTDTIGIGDMRAVMRHLEGINRNNIGERIRNTLLGINDVDENVGRYGGGFPEQGDETEGQ